MATYMILMKMTPEGAKQLKSWPESIDGAIEKLRQWAEKRLVFMPAVSNMTS